MRDAIDLPLGMTCGDCLYWNRCSALITSLSKFGIRCRWKPSNFVQGKERTMLKDPNIEYVAVRLATDAGYEWMDLSSISGSREVTGHNANLTDKQIPDWATANPVQRIAKVEIHEIEEG